jgi:hypothetical protein
MGTAIRAHQLSLSSESLVVGYDADYNAIITAGLFFVRRV